MECDGLAIYKSLIRKEETTTGQPSARKPDATMAVACEDPEVLEIQKIRMIYLMQHWFVETEVLIENVKKFLNVIMASVKSMPFGMRYIAMQLKECMKEQFKGQEEDIIRSIGNLIYYRYMNPAIV